MYSILSRIVPPQRCLKYPKSRNWCLCYFIWQRIVCRHLKNLGWKDYVRLSAVASVILKEGREEGPRLPERKVMTKAKFIVICLLALK